MSSSSWGGAVTGVVLVALGVIFLIQNALGYELRNWWALFILIPAFAVLAAAYQSWRAGNTAAAAGSFTMGLVILAVATIFLLDLPWRLAWPVLIILTGSACCCRSSWDEVATRRAS